MSQLEIEKLRKDILHLERKIDRLTKLLEQQYKPLWVKASVITSLTIFSNNEKLRQARENGYLQWKERDGKFWYNLSSIHPKLIKPNN